MQSNKLLEKIANIILDYHVDSYDDFVLCLKNHVTLVDELMELIRCNGNGWIYLAKQLGDGWYCICVPSTNNSYQIYYQERGVVEGEKELVMGKELAVTFVLRYSGYLNF